MDCGDGFVGDVGMSVYEWKLCEKGVVMVVLCLFV